MSILKRNVLLVESPIPKNVKFLNLFKSVHDLLEVYLPEIDVNNRELVFPESVDIHRLCERFRHMPFYDILENKEKEFSKLTVDITNTTEEIGYVRLKKFSNPSLFADTNCNFIRMKPLERLYIPVGGIILKKKLLRDDLSASLLEVCDITLGEKRTTMKFKTIYHDPKKIFDFIIKRIHGLMDEAEKILEKADPQEHSYVEGKYFHVLNTIADYDKNLSIENNTSADYYDKEYVKLRLVSKDTIKESIKIVRDHVNELSIG